MQSKLWKKRKKKKKKNRPSTVNSQHTGRLHYTWIRVRQATTLPTALKKMTHNNNNKVILLNSINHKQRIVNNFDCFWCFNIWWWLLFFSSSLYSDVHVPSTCIFGSAWWIWYSNIYISIVGNVFHFSKTTTTNPP